MSIQTHLGLGAAGCLAVLSALACSVPQPPSATASGAPNTTQGEAADEGVPLGFVTPDANGRRPVGSDPGHVGRGTPLVARPGHELAAFAGGCFWGVEDAFRQIRGVTATAVGFTGGHTDMPTYDAVCEHGTGHAETVLVEFDPATVSYAQLVRAFFQLHDPTTPNRQGPDEGDQYRSGVFTFSPAQDAVVRAAMGAAQSRLGKRVVTRVEPIGRFYLAEDYHQQYAERTGSHGCPVGKITGM